jgi:hypothetical protein
MFLSTDVGLFCQSLEPPSLVADISLLFFTSLLADVSSPAGGKGKRKGIPTNQFASPRTPNESR